jgi:hypothetical protein
VNRSLGRHYGALIRSSRVARAAPWPRADIEVTSTRPVDKTDVEIDVTITVEIADAAGHLVGKCDGRCDILEAAVVLPIQPIRTTPNPDEFVEFAILVEVGSGVG